MFNYDEIVKRESEASEKIMNEPLNVPDFKENISNDIDRLIVLCMEQTKIPASIEQMKGRAERIKQAELKFEQQSIITDKSLNRRVDI